MFCLKDVPVRYPNPRRPSLSSCSQPCKKISQNSRLGSPELLQVIVQAHSYWSAANLTQNCWKQENKFPLPSKRSLAHDRALPPFSLLPYLTHAAAFTAQSSEAAVPGGRDQPEILLHRCARQTCQKQLNRNFPLFEYTLPSMLQSFEETCDGNLPPSELSIDSPETVTKAQRAL